MQHIIEALRRGATLSKEEGGRAPSSVGIRDDGRLARRILTRLGKGEVPVPADAGGAPVPRDTTRMRHIRQTDTWDCGLVCVQMVLEWLRRRDEDADVANNNDEDAIDRSLERERREKARMMDCVNTRSIWTIDLVMLLEHIFSDSNRHDNKTDCILCCQRKRCLHHSDSFSYGEISSASYLYCSTTFEVNNSYNTMGYYKDAFSVDEVRVKRLMGIARQRKLPMLQTSHLSLEALVDVVSRRDVVAVVLLDNRILRNDASDSYSGHYVVLCGTSKDENDVNYSRMNSPDASDDRHKFCMVLKNPGIWKQTEYVAPSLFERAWRAEGTDEDVIFLAKHGS